MKAYEPPNNEPEEPDGDPVPPLCRATVESIQRALDGTATPDVFDADAHAGTCPTCRERLRAARGLLSVLALPPESVAVPAGFADRVLATVEGDRRVHTRSRAYKAAAWLALAAAVLVGVWVIAKSPAPTTGEVVVVPPDGPQIAPAPREKAPAAPDPRPLRMSDALANTGQALLEAPKSLTDSVAAAPKVFGALSDSFKLPAPNVDPMGTALEPARKSLAELPEAVGTGLEPVTGTAEKALARFLRDMSSVKPNSQ